MQSSNLGKKSWRSLGLSVLAAPLLAALPVTAANADDGIKLPPISIGGGIRTSFNHDVVDGPAHNTNDFSLDDARLYITGSVTPWLKLTFNTEYSGSSDSVEVMDAIARFEFSPEVNIWAGRFLPPSDRANLYGPFYANHWGVYRDGVEDGYANTAVGRDNGVAYWGDFGGLKVSIGGFDVPATSAGSPKSDKIIAAGRVQYDFWDKESGYFLNGTYYGEKDLLAVGAAGQTTDGDTSYSFDLLVEKNFKDVGVFTLESEYARYKGLTGGGLDALGDPTKSKGGTGLVSYLFPEAIGVGKVQLLGKYAIASTVEPGPNPKQKTAEFDVGYIVKEFNLRGYLFLINETFDHSAAPDNSSVGLGLQIQM